MPGASACSGRSKLQMCTLAYLSASRPLASNSVTVLRGPSADRSRYVTPIAMPQLRGEVRVGDEPRVVAGDRLRPPALQVAVAEGVAGAPQLREQRDVGAGRGGAAAGGETALEARLAVVARAGELQERDAELGRAHSRAASPPLAARANTVVSPGCRTRTSTSGARCAA